MKSYERRTSRILGRKREYVDLSLTDLRLEGVEHELIAYAACLQKMNQTHLIRQATMNGVRSILRFHNLTHPYLENEIAYLADLRAELEAEGVLIYDPRTSRLPLEVRCRLQDRYLSPLRNLTRE